MRTFDGGATRDDDTNKPDYEGFLSPLVVVRFGKYMMKHQIQADGERRASDNWQNGIPKDAYMKSLMRHNMDLWLEHRGYKSRDGLEEALCAIMFNAMGYLHEHLKSMENSEEEDTPDFYDFQLSIDVPTNPPKLTTNISCATCGCKLRYVCESCTQCDKWRPRWDCV